MASSQSTPLSSFKGVAVLDHAVVGFTGADTREWLQGQVTQDLRLLEAGGSVRACLCKATGQLLSHLEIWDLGTSLRVLVARSELPALMSRVEEAVIMEDVEANVLALRVMHAYGEDVRVNAREPDLFRARSRTGSSGFDVVVAASVVENPDLEQIRGHFDALTLAAGEPIPGLDTNEKTLPPELGPAFEAATTSYRKGCYTGQEVLMRIHSRGHTNRTWRGLLSPEPLAAGAKVLADGAEMGKITRAGVHPVLGPIAAAFLRREAEGKALTIETAKGPTAVEARDLPLFSQ